jgi:DNA-directed RNA polymerase subunit RPC12/RpoP
VIAVSKKVPSPQAETLSCMIHNGYECLFYDLLQRSTPIKACKQNAHENQYMCSESVRQFDRVDWARSNRCPMCREQLCEISANEKLMLKKTKLTCHYCGEQIENCNFSEHILEGFRRFTARP